MSILLFNGVTSASVHSHIVEPPEYQIPERDYDTIHIDGRNGDVIIDSGCYKNVDRKYKMSMDAHTRNLDYPTVASSVATWLHPITQMHSLQFSTAANDIVKYYDGYCELQDSYDPEHFRLAKFKGDEDISNIFNKAGEFDLKFDCKPQRFLISGKTPVTTTTITNNTSQAAKPLIKVVFSAANGYLNISNTSAGYSARIKSSAAETTIIDCSEEDCYYGTANRNQHITFLKNSASSYEFPLLYPGANTISVSSVSSWAIIPNWWDL